LPENKPGTLTNIALRYLRTPTSLTLQRTENEVSGRLTDQRGAPIADAKIAIEAIDASAAMGPTPRSETRTVPDNAATAVVGIRAGLEGSCICDGVAAAIVAGIQYQEQGTNRHEDISPVSLPIDGAPASTRTLKLTPGMSYAPNLRQFPVTPGATFTLSTAIAATKSADHAGYVTIIFMDAGGKGGRRDFLWFEPSRRTLGEVTTGPNGGYQIRLPLAAALAPQTIRATFEGNIAMRPAWAEHFAPNKTGAPAPALAEPVVNPKQKLIVFAPRKDFWQAYENGASWDDLAKQWPKGSASINTLALTEGQVRLLQDDTLMRLMHDLNAHHFAPQLGILATNWFHEPPSGGGVEGYSDPGSANATVAKLLLAVHRPASSQWMSRSISDTTIRVRTPAAARSRMSPNGRLLS
jgi:hypothetical protein